MSFIDEGWERPEPSEPVDVDRAYGEIIPFEKAFHPISVAKLSVALSRDNPMWVAGIGLAVLIAAVALPLELRIPLPEPLEDTFRASSMGLFVGYAVHRTLSFQLGAFVSAIVSALALATVARFLRGHQDPFADLFDRELLAKVVFYEVVVEIAALLASVPFVVASVGLSGTASLISVSLALGVVMLIEIITRPGLWALTVDGLQPRDALIGSVVGSMRHPLTLLMVHAAYVAAIFASLCVFAFAVIGGFHLGIAAAWIAFGATREELDAMPWIEEALD